MLPLSSQQPWHRSGPGAWLEAPSVQTQKFPHETSALARDRVVTEAYCNPRSRLEGSGSRGWQKQEWAFPGLPSPRAGGRQAGGQGLQSLLPGLETHNCGPHKAPALITLGLGSGKLCCTPRAHVALLGAEEQAAGFPRQMPRRVAGSCPLLPARGQLGGRTGLLLVHHHLPQTLFLDT